MQTLVRILVFFFLFPSTAFSTSIVAVKGSDEIVIGADSKTTLTSAGGAAASPESIAKCKIVQTGNLFFASAGASGIGPAGSGGDIDPGFDIRGAIVRGLRGSGDIVERVGNLEKVLVADLTRIAEEARQHNAAFFLQRFVRRPAHTIVIAGIEHGEPVLMVRTFTLVTSASGSLSFEIGRYACPGDCRTPFVTIFEGQTEAIRNYLQDHGLFLYFTDAVTVVRDMVGLEISKSPSSVGPPIDILRLTKKGAEWIQKKSLCPDIEKASALPGMESGG